MNRHEPTVIAAARSQMTASSPRGTFSQAELAGDRVITRCITRCLRPRRPAALAARNRPPPGRGACALGACLPAGQPGLGG